MKAKGAVTLSEAVGEPNPGTKPIRLQKRMKKKMVRMNGRKRSASWSSDAGANHRVADEQHDGLEHVPKSPFGRSLASFRASGTKISTINRATMSSMTMNRVI